MNEQVNGPPHNARNFPPRDPELPDIDEPWSKLLITHSNMELAYASVEDPNVVYRVPLATREERSQGPERNRRIERRFELPLIQHCIHQIEWRFPSEPRIDTTKELEYLLSFAALGDSAQVERLVFDISEQAGSYVLELLPFVSYPYGGLVRDVRLKIRNGNFSDGGVALQIFKSLEALERKWQDSMLMPEPQLRLGLDDVIPLVIQGERFVEIQVEVSNLTTEGRIALERVSPMIASITFDHLRQQDMLNHLTEFLQKSERDVKINIKNFELRGETTIYLPRGNVSLSIEAISGEPKIVLECEEKLAYLAITKEVAQRLVGPELDINELRVTGNPTAAAVQQITARFANVGIITTDC
ncbi:hypothetical protein TRVA0_016S01112 [Trichomonascus vanleenenianus]|uniref:uncharacterized protein n=1 Tax=Trichomonascus vanleenenianus TaxID=2268995 RepID=UPI003ECB7A3A